MLSLLAMGLLGACGSHTAPIDHGAGSTGTWRSGLEAHPVIGPEIGTTVPIPLDVHVGCCSDVVSDGHGFLTLQTIGRHAVGKRVSADGEVQDLVWLDFGPGSAPHHAGWGISQDFPTAAVGAGRYLVVWSESEANPNMYDEGADYEHSWEARGLRARVVHPDGTLAGSQSFEVGGTPKAGFPAIVWDGQHFLVAWSERETDGTSHVFLGLLNADGSRVDGAERRVSTRGHAALPRLAHGSSHTFLTWQEDTADPNGGTTGVSVWGTRISAAGEPMDTDGLELAPVP